MQRCIYCEGEIYPPVEGDPIHPDPSGCIAHFMAREERDEKRIAALEAEVARLLGEPVTGYVVAGGLLILAGVAAAQFGPALIARL